MTRLNSGFIVCRGQVEGTLTIKIRAHSNFLYGFSISFCPSTHTHTQRPKPNPANTRAHLGARDLTSQSADLRLYRPLAVGLYV